MERLQKVIAQAGVASRRNAEKLILEGKVKVNGIVVKELGTKVSKKDFVEVNGKELLKEEYEYYVINKPQKTLCSNSDEHGRNLVVDLIASTKRLYTVGRLDYDTSGVLLVTNDGEFANSLTHPKFKIKKTYELIVDTIIKPEEMKALEQGIKLDDGYVTAPAKAWILFKDFENKQTKLELTIHEGKNRQVKRMIEALGHKVRKLHRKQFGTIVLKEMGQGDYRRLKPFEIKQLKTLALEGKLLSKR